MSEELKCERFMTQTFNYRHKVQQNSERPINILVLSRNMLTDLFYKIRL